MNFEKKVARVISIIFHPLLMPSLGMLLLLNSGSYLSLLSSDAKRAMVMIILLSTLLFPISILPVLYYRKLVSDIQIQKREERTLPFLLILILYILTFIFLKRMPLHTQIHAYALTLPLMVFFLLLANIKFKISTHMMGVGGITGLIISLIIIFGLPLQLLFILAVLVSGLVCTSRIILTDHSGLELYGGYFLGLLVTALTMLIY